MKIAVTGKGGVGKSTVAAYIALSLAAGGGTVLALDADPDANLASALGITPDEKKIIKPISEQIDLIEERTDAKVDQYGRVFKLNPHVADITEKFAYTKNGVSLLVLGAVRKGGGGCACPESTFIRSLVTDLILFKNETLIMDMEAGIEHLGRATAQGVDLMMIVVEPGQRSVDTAKTIIRMSKELGIKKLAFVGNKITSDNDKDFLSAALPDQKFLAFLPYSQKLRDADRDGSSVLNAIEGDARTAFGKMLEEIEGYNI
jgi:CO dehydrogenase maturation factor